jgi:hypothetical protein
VNAGFFSVNTEGCAQRDTAPLVVVLMDLAPGLGPKIPQNPSCTIFGCHEPEPPKERFLRLFPNRKREQVEVSQGIY